MKVKIQGKYYRCDTMRNLLSACCACKTKEDAKIVLNEYKRIEPTFAEKNLGYAFGYVEPPEERQRLYALFPTCNHPIFGPGFGRGKEISAKEAFGIGVETGKQMKVKK